MKKSGFAFGTRPEAIKMCPLVKALARAESVWRWNGQRKYRGVSEHGGLKERGKSAE